MKITILSSGSKGNATIIETNKHNIMIDAGITYSKAKERMPKIPKIDTIIITHCHSDHIKGLKSFIKEYNPNIYMLDKDIYEIDNKKVSYGENFILDDININLFEVSHDVKCSGISIIENNKELIYITDTGYINNKILKNIVNKDMYIIESNHDIEMLRNGTYPFYLKQRILGDSGHLSNDTTAKYLKKIIGPKTKTIVLAHLSEENNTPSKALECSSKVINKDINLYAATAEEALNTIIL